MSYVMISGFDGGVDEDCSLLQCYASEGTVCC